MSLLKQALNIKAPNLQRLPQTNRAATGMLQPGTGLFSNQSQAAMLAAYGQTGWLYATVQRISQARACIEWRLLRRLTNGDDEEVFDHEALHLWNSPSPFISGEEFRESGGQHLELVGEWWVIFLTDSSGTPVELQIVRPDRMSVIPDAENYVKGYVYQIGAERIPLEPEQVMLIKLPNPMDPYRGLGPVQALIPDLQSERLAAEFSRNTFNNNAQPGGVIEFDDELSDADFEQLVTRWREQHKGVSNVNRVAILERGKWKDTQMTMRNLQMDALRKLNMDIIVGAYGLPKALLGVSEGVNRANAEAAEVMFARWLVKPGLDRIKAVLNHRFLPLFDNTGTLRFEYANPSPDDRDRDLLEAVQGYDSEILTQNESRARLGEGEVEGGDEFKRRPEPSLPFGGGFGDDEQRHYWKGWSKQEDHPLLDNTVERQEHRVASNWARRLEAEQQGLAGHIRDFFSRRAKIELSDLDTYDWDWWGKYSDDVILDLMRLYDVSVMAEGVAVSPARVQVLAADYARQRAAELLRFDGDANLVSLTRRRVSELVARNIEQGQGFAQLRKALQEDFSFSPQRAMVVARTETATALGQGQKQLALEQGRDEKMWVTMGDDHVDIDLCRRNERQGWIRLVDPFLSGHDTVPAHPNCRCVVRYRTSAGRTNIDPSEGVADDIASAIEESRLISEARCGECRTWLRLTDFRGAAKAWCTKCKKEHPIMTDMYETERRMVFRDGDGAIADIRTFHANGSK